MKRKTFPLKNFILFIIFVFLMVTTYLLYYGKEIGLQNGITIASVLYLFAFILGLYVIKFKTGSFISLMTFFWVSFFLFHGSQVVMNLFGMNDGVSYNIFNNYRMDSIAKATLYSTICEIMFCFGMLLNKVDYSHRRDVDIEDYFYIIRKFSRVILTVSVVPFLYYIFKVLSVGINTGYGAINDYSNYGSSFLMKIAQFLVYFFIAGAFLAVISYYNTKRNISRLCFGIIIAYSIILLLLGERTDPTSMILLALWLDAYLERLFGRKSKSKKKIITAVVVIGVLTTVFPVIMSLRHNGIISLSELVYEIRTNGVFETMKDSVSGIGYSMMPLIETRRLVAEGEPLMYGRTYIAAATNVVPYLGFAEKYASLSKWLMTRLNMSYGPGFSMAAEAYLNFGDFPISMIPFGYFFSKILMWKKDELNVRKMIRGVLFIVTCLTLPRREIASRVRFILYIVILIPLLIDLAYGRYQEKKL